MLLFCWYILIVGGAFPGSHVVGTVQNLLRVEGFRGLYRGLGMHLVGIFPARSIHFFLYGNTKNFLIDKEVFDKDSSMVPLCSAILAGFTVVTTTQPIWFVKTRLQLQTKTAKETVCIHNVTYNSFTQDIWMLFVMQLRKMDLEVSTGV